jgi:Ca2+-binding EF-hand superfamily protein
MKPPSRGTKLSNITPKKTASLGKATVDRTVWLGGIPDAIKRDKSLIARSLETQYGAVESLQIREKSDGKSWAFAVFKKVQSAFNAAVMGIKGIQIEDMRGASFTLQVEPVALRKELDEFGALASMWSKTVKQSTHGKHLQVLQDKLEAKGGNAHTAFRVFKGFQRKGANPHDVITLEEFKTACTKLNLGVQDDEMEAMFVDLGGRTDAGGITVSQLYQLVMGSDKDLQSLVWEEDAAPPKGRPQYDISAFAATGGTEHGETAAVERTVWVGNISKAVTSCPFERDVQHSFERQFGAIEFAEFRIKQGSDRSWGFITFQDPACAQNATARGTVSVDVQGVRHTVTVKPASVDKEAGESGAFPSMWTNAVEHTAHGKHLKALRAKLEARGGNAHSAFRAFKSLDANADKVSTGYLTRDEFLEGCRILNLGMSRDDVDALFVDIGGAKGKGLTTKDLYTIVMGSDKDLTRERFGN